jgi:hypothetical protein
LNAISVSLLLNSIRNGCGEAYDIERT